MQQFSSLLSWSLFTAQHVSGVFPPIIRSSMTAVAASGFAFVSWWQLYCVRGRAGRLSFPVCNLAILPSCRLSAVQNTNCTICCSLQHLQWLSAGFSSAVMRLSWLLTKTNACGATLMMLECTVLCSLCTVKDTELYAAFRRKKV